jgi:hypothetical protein
MNFIPPHTLAPGETCERLKTDEGCYWHCGACDHDTHTCPGCGEPLSHLGKENKGRRPDAGIIWKPHEGCTD